MEAEGCRSSPRAGSCSWFRLTQFNSTLCALGAAGKPKAGSWALLGMSSCFFHWVLWEVSNPESRLFALEAAPVVLFCPSQGFCGASHHGEGMDLVP